MDNKGTILLVEDQEGFRRIYKDVLNADGYEVLTAEDGEAGWEMAKQKKPGLVLLDLGLPKVDGFEVLRRMREDAETKNIPVIIFSVMGEQKDIKKALGMGANDYTVKGFYTPRQILSKVKSLLTQADMKKNATAYKLLIKPGREDAAKLQEEIGLTNGYECSECKVELTLEMFPDYVREGGHWFSSRLVCPKCGKSV
jgi:two-component system, OmpR family, alkaline phosphatase synthesis response regulator PhoP